MRESLLKALMQFFALLTDVKQEEQSGIAHSLVDDYLKRHFNNEYASKYLLIFEGYLDQYHKETLTSNKDAQLKQSKDNQKEVAEICNQLNKELETSEKISLFIQLLQFLRKESDIGAEELCLLNNLASHLLINIDDFEALKAFILDDPTKVKNKESILIISGNPEDAEKGYKYIFNERQQVTVWFLQIKSTDTFVFRHSGERNLYLNGNRVNKDRPYILAPGTVIKTSLMPPIYYGSIAEKFLDTKKRARILYKATDVEYKFNPTQIATHKFSLLCRSGQFWGILGGSGTGKTTLLNVLNGTLKLSHGKITINGFNLHTEREHLEGVIGYVPQEDLLIEELTVYQNLYFNAKLCFSEQSDEQIDEIIDTAVEDFDLVEARDLIVGSPLKKILSGGQRKRLNIALELMRQPSILLVDEPTSGLSSIDSEKVMTLLKRQTLKGRLVIINIHQPSSDLYKLLDKILLIDKGGRIIYNGNPMDAIEYFKREANYVNPEERECGACGNVKTEQPLRIIEARMVNPEGKVVRERKVKPEEWYQKYIEKFEDKYTWKNKKGRDKKEEIPKNLFKIPNRRNQFLLYFKRDLMSKIKNRQYLLLTLGEAPILAFILCFFTKYIAESNYIFADNVNLPAYLFMCIIVAMFFGLNVSAEEIIKDKKLLKRESFLNLSRGSYLASKVTIMVIISAIQTLMFVLIGNNILEIQGLTFSYWAILFTVSCFSNMLGLNISSGMNSVVAIYIIIPLILVPQILFSGVIVDFDKLHKSIASNEKVPLIGNMMISRWGVEALTVNQFKNNKFEKNFFEYDMAMSTCSYYSSLYIPGLELRNEEALWAYQNNDTAHLRVQKDILEKNLPELALHLNDKNVFNISDSTYSKKTFSDLEKYLDSAKTNLRYTYNIYERKKDIRYNELINEFGSKEAVWELKKKNYNSKLAQWVMKKSEVQKISLVDGKYQRKKDPIYMDPLFNNGEAHFFAPYKKVGKIKISTPLFNIMFIWFFSIILYFTLYFDSLRVVIHYFERFKLRQQTNRLMKLRI